MAAAKPTYPDDCIQGLCDPWWEETPKPRLEYGQLIKAFLPHVDQQPYVLVVKGRSDPESHDQADFEIRPLVANSPPAGAYLPVAGLPTYDGEVRIVQRAKRRPALVLSRPGIEVEGSLRTGEARYQTNRCVLVAPFYGADRSAKRGGWKPEFVERIRRAWYPQYAWEHLPIGGANESILRFDQIQPLGEHAPAIELTPFRLSSDASAVIEEWLHWFRSGELDQDGVLAYFRAQLSGLSPT